MIPQVVFFLSVAGANVLNLSVVLVKSHPEFPQLCLALGLILAHSSRRKFRQTLVYDVHDANCAQD